MGFLFQFRYFSFCHRVVATDTSLGLLQKCVEILSARADIQHGMLQFFFFFC